MREHLGVIAGVKGRADYGLNWDRAVEMGGRGRFKIRFGGGNDIGWM